MTAALAEPILPPIWLKSPQPTRSAADKAIVTARRLQHVNTAAMPALPLRLTQLQQPPKPLPLHERRGRVRHGDQTLLVAKQSVARAPPDDSSKPELVEEAKDGSTGADATAWQHYEQQLSSDHFSPRRQSVVSPAKPHVTVPSKRDVESLKPSPSSANLLLNDNGCISAQHRDSAVSQWLRDTHEQSHNPVNPALDRQTAHLPPSHAFHPTNTHLQHLLQPTVDQWVNRHKVQIKLTLSDADKQKAKELFQMIDYDESATIEVDELIQAFTELQLPTSVDEIRQRITMIDKEGNLTYDQFLMNYASIAGWSELDRLIEFKRQREYKQQQLKAKFKTAHTQMMKNERGEYVVVNTKHRADDGEQAPSMARRGSIARVQLSRSQSSDESTSQNNVDLPFHLFAPSFHRHKVVSAVIDKATIPKAHILQQQKQQQEESDKERQSYSGSHLRRGSISREQHTASSKGVDLSTHRRRNSVASVFSDGEMEQSVIQRVMQAFQLDTKQQQSHAQLMASPDRRNKRLSLLVPENLEELALMMNMYQQPVLSSKSSVPKLNGKRASGVTASTASLSSAKHSESLQQLLQQCSATTSHASLHAVMSKQSLMSDLSAATLSPVRESIVASHRKSGSVMSMVSERQAPAGRRTSDGLSGMRERVKFMALNDRMIRACKVGAWEEVLEMLNTESVYAHPVLNATMTLSEQRALYVNRIDAAGSTALHHCAWFGHHKVAHVLLLHGANATAQNNRLNTPLHLAIEKHQREFCALLIQFGTRLQDTYNWRSLTPLNMLAVDQERTAAECEAFKAFLLDCVERAERRARGEPSTDEDPAIRPPTAKLSDEIPDRRSPIDLFRYTDYDERSLSNLNNTHVFGSVGRRLASQVEAQKVTEMVDHPDATGDTPKRDSLPDKTYQRELRQQLREHSLVDLWQKTLDKVSQRHDSPHTRPLTADTNDARADSSSVAIRSMDMLDIAVETNAPFDSLYSHNNDKWYTDDSMAAMAEVTTKS